MTRSHTDDLQMNLPIELVYDIVDHLDDDIPALCACSLISHAWLVPARRALFRRVYIQEPEEEEGDVLVEYFGEENEEENEYGNGNDDNGNEEGEREGALAGEEPNTLPSRVSTFVRFLRTSPMFIQDVEELHIQGSIPHPYRIAQSWLHVDTILAIVRDLPLLTSFVVEGFRISLTPSTPISDGSSFSDTDQLQHRPVIRNLAFVDVDMTRSHLYRVLSYIPSVHTLQLLTATVDGCLEPVKATLPDLGIRSLVIEGLSHLGNISAMILFRFMPSLKHTLTSLDLDLISRPLENHGIDEEVRLFGRFLSDVGPGLLDLRLDLTLEPDLYKEPSLCIMPFPISTAQLMRLHSTAIQQLWSALNLSACTSLRSFWLCFDDTRYYRSGNLTDNPLVTVSSIFMDSGTIQTLRDMTIVQNSSRFEDPIPGAFSPGLSEFEHKVLLFPNLRCVRFLHEDIRIDYRPMRTMVQPIDPRRWEWLTTKLPELHRRGILRNQIGRIEDCGFIFQHVHHLSHFRISRTCFIVYDKFMNFTGHDVHTFRKR